jgi:transposase
LAHTPRELLLRKGIKAERCNRFKLGRPLDAVYAYGCDLLCEALARAICVHDGIDLRFNHLATTSVALTGESSPDRDEHAMRSTQGDSTDHRPDLQQAVVERLGSQDGGGPFVSTRWDGHTSDTPVFQERAAALLSAFKDTPSPRSLVAAATLSCEAKAAHLAQLGCIPRLPAPLTVVSPVIRQTLQQDTCESCDADPRDQPLAVCHDGMAQRWLVVSSRAARERADATLTHATPRAYEASTQPLLHRPAQRFCAPEAAPEARAALVKRWPYHRVESSQLTEHNRYAGTGRPTRCTPLKAIAWPIQAHVHADDDTLAQDKHAKAGAVLGTNIAASK